MRNACTPILFVLGLAAVSACFATRTHAAELCHRPSPQTLINWYNSSHPDNPLHYDVRNSAIYHPISILRTNQPTVYWIGLAWLSPVSGALFVINCAGQPLDGVAVGAIGNLSPGPALPELGQTVMLVYVNKETAECVHDSIQIAALKDNKIISLWEHDYNQGLNVVAHGKSHRFIAENYSVSFVDRGLTLRLDGVRAVYAYLKDGSQAPAPFITQMFETETWHWSASALRFIPEKHYSSLPACAKT